MGVDGLLAVDCSLRLTGVALAHAGRVVASETRDLGRQQSAELPLMAERLLGEAGWTWGDIRRVAVTCGPGYFTGIRVGAAYASALAYGLGVPLVPVSSLEMLALSRPEGRNGELVLVYAGRRAVYAESFGVDPPLPRGEYTGTEIASWLSAHPGLSVISDNPERALNATDLELSILRVQPDAACLARAAWERPSIPPGELRINYCRAPV